MDALRAHLIELLGGEGAHAPFEKAVAGLPPELRGAKPPNAPHSPWELVEHLRIALEDMLDYSRNPNYKERKWPDTYWPASPAPPDDQAWDRSVAAYQAAIEAFQSLIGNERTDLQTPSPTPKGKPLLRNVLVIADHNAYHIGQIVFARIQLGSPI